MPKLKKLLSQFDEKERRIILYLIETIISLDWQNLDIKKLKGRQHVFRVRKGNLRIIYQQEGRKIFILAISRRREDMYK